MTSTLSLDLKMKWEWLVTVTNLEDNLKGS